MTYQTARLSSPRLLAIAMGYVVQLVGVGSIFWLPLVASLMLTVLGLVLVALATRGTVSIPSFDARTRWVMVGGVVAIAVVLLLIGEETVRQWRPHPAGYVPLWIFGVMMVTHLRRLSREETAGPSPR